VKKESHQIFYKIRQRWVTSFYLQVVGRHFEEGQSSICAFEGPLPHPCEMEGEAMSAVTLVLVLGQQESYNGCCLDDCCMSFKEDISCLDESKCLLLNPSGKKFLVCLREELSYLG
jgi:hypothetical protein